MATRSDEEVVSKYKIRFVLVFYNYIIIINNRKWKVVCFITLIHWKDEKICLFIVEKSKIRLVYILFVDTRGFQKCMGEEESDKFVELSGGSQWSKHHIFFIPTYNEYYIRYSWKNILFNFKRNHNQPLYTSYNLNTDFWLAGVMVTFKFVNMTQISVWF
jgi:hypothetical protein